jgi:hypothetical protein
MNGSSGPILSTEALSIFQNRSRPPPDDLDVGRLTAKLNQSTVV